MDTNGVSLRMRCDSQGVAKAARGLSSATLGRTWWKTWLQWLWIQCWAWTTFKPETAMWSIIGRDCRFSSKTRSGSGNQATSYQSKDSLIFMCSIRGLQVCFCGSEACSIECSAMAAVSLGLVFVSSCNEEASHDCYKHWVNMFCKAAPKPSLHIQTWAICTTWRLPRPSFRLSLKDKSLPHWVYHGRVESHWMLVSTYIPWGSGKCPERNVATFLCCRFGCAPHSDADFKQFKPCKRNEGHKGSSRLQSKSIVASTVVLAVVDDQCSRLSCWFIFSLLLLLWWVVLSLSSSSPTI